MSLRAKLVLWYTGVFALSGAVLATALYWLIAHKMLGEADQFLEDEFGECARITLATLPDTEALAEAIEREIGGTRDFPLAYRLRDDREGRDIAFLVTPRLRRILDAPPPPGTRPDADGYSLVLLDGKRSRPLRLLTRPLDPTTHPHLSLHVGMYMRRLYKRNKALRDYLFLILGLVLLVAALGGWFLASRSLKPIDDTVGELSHIESANLGERLAVGEAGDELDRLREAINRMLERLEMAFTSLENFTADAAHELRTPISALKCRLEVTMNKARSEVDYQAALADALEQAAKLQTLVDNLLLLARMDAEAGSPAAQHVDLASLCHDLVEPFCILAEQKGVALRLDCPGRMAVDGDPVLLRRLFGSLIDNAVRYTPAGGQVTVGAARDGEACLITVADTGIGIEPDALEHIFDRFYRADGSRSREVGGVGLGLSIARRVVELHRGHIAIDSQPGRGTTVRVRLPQSRLPTA